MKTLFEIGHNEIFEFLVGSLFVGIGLAVLVVIILLDLTGDGYCYLIIVFPLVAMISTLITLLLSIKSTTEEEDESYY